MKYWLYSCAGFSLLIPFYAVGATVCDANDSPKTCLDKVQEEQASKAPDQLNAQAHAETSAAVNARNTGVGPGVSEGQNASVNDFLSKFKLSTDLGDLGGDDGESLIFELNNLLGLPGVKGLKLTTALRKPDVYEPLVLAIPEDGRADTVANLDKKLGDTDEIRLRFTYAPQNSRFGRNYQTHSTLFSKLLEYANSTVSKADTLEFDRAYNEVLDSIIDELPDTFQGNPEQTPFEDLAPDNIQELIAAAEGAFRANLTEMAAMRAALDEAGFYDFASLVDNQPQFYVGAQYTSRDDLAGPDEFTLRAAYEMGFINVNSFRRHLRHDCLDNGETEKSIQMTDYVTCFSNYLNEEENGVKRIAQATRGDRLAFSLDYTRRQSYGFTLDTAMLNLDLPSESSLEANVTYGRYLNFLGGDVGETRMDVGIGYVDVMDDPSRQDRGTASATFSQKLSSNAVLSVGFVYGSKPEYRGEVDEEISARLGINYKIDR